VLNLKNNENELKLKSEEPDDDDQTFNPFGELLETACRLDMSPPEVIYGNEDGPIHNRVYECTIKIADLEQTGYAKNKRLAKRQASLKILVHLRAYANTKDQEKKSNLINRDKLLMEHNIINESQTNLVSRIKSSKKNTITYLINYDGDLSKLSLNTSILKKLADEEGFEYTFLPIKNQYKGKFKVFKLRFFILN
jgi:hypothetical protein